MRRRSVPRVQADRLTDIASRLLQAAGASPDEASTVARHCIGANLAGHDSHGIIAIPTYIDRMKVGHIVAGAPIEIVQETPATTVVDGNWGFGFVVSEYVMRTTIEKARRNGVAAATVRRQGHVGRVADYPLMAARSRHDRYDDRRLGPLGEVGRPLRRTRAAARHQPDMHRHAQRSWTGPCSSTWRPARWRAAS